MCRSCYMTCESRHIHDFVMCECGKVAADGGLEYLRRVGTPSDYLELAEYAVGE